MCEHNRERQTEWVERRGWRRGVRTNRQGRMVDNNCRRSEATTNKLQIEYSPPRSTSQSQLASLPAIVLGATRAARSTATATQAAPALWDVKCRPISAGFVSHLSSFAWSTTAKKAKREEREARRIPAYPYPESPDDPIRSSKVSAAEPRVPVTQNPEPHQK